MAAFGNETSSWIEERFADEGSVEVEIGSLIAAISGWTEDESEMDDLLGGLLETGQLALCVG